MCNEITFDHEELERKLEQARLEGALGYCLRVAEKISKKITIKELDEIVQEDFTRASTSIAKHYKIDLHNAGFETAFLNDYVETAELHIEER
jgi:hypothetical protein